MYKFQDIEINPVLESYLFDLRLSQEPKNRLRYYDKALESITAGSGEMLQKLYAEVLSKNTYDFSLISESKGDIARYKDYDNMYKCIEYLNSLFEKAGGKGSRELTVMNKLHDTILALRGDFVFGYKTNIQLIKIVYENMVLTLHQLINVCIIMYMNYLKDKNKKNLSQFNSGKKDMVILNSADNFIKMYQSGEWNIIMREFKKDPKGFFGSIVTSAIGLGLGVATLGGPEKIGQQAKGFATAVGAAPGAIKSAFTNMSAPGWLKAFSKYALILAAIILIIRGCAYMYHKLPIKVKEFAKTEAEFIKVNSDGELSGVESKVIDVLERVAGTAETKIIKANAEADEDIKHANSTLHSLSSEDEVELF